MKRRPVPIFKIGLFVLAGFIILLTFIFFIGGQDKLFSRTAKLRASFQTVSGLKSGAQVQMSGINVGSVVDIQLPKSPADKVVVTMKIIDKAMQLIRTDSRAIITTEGLIGDKIIKITVGEPGKPVVAERSILQGESPSELGSITDSVNLALSKLNSLTQDVSVVIEHLKDGKGSIGRLLNDERLYTDLDGLVRQTRLTVSNADRSITALGQSFNGVADKANIVAAKIDGFAEGINRGEGSLGRLLKSDELYNNIQVTANNLQNSSLELRDAMAKLSLGSGRFAEVAEGLKHNFLVKGYFEDRGYWDAADFELTVDRKLDSLRTLRKALEAEQNGKPSPKASTR